MRRLFREGTARTVRCRPLIGPMLAKASTDAVAHIERRLVGAEAHDALNLQCADAFFADQHHVDDPEPVAERFIRVFEDGANQNGEPIAARLGAFGTLPVEGPISHGINVNIPASRAMDAFRRHAVRWSGCGACGRICSPLPGGLGIMSPGTMTGVGGASLDWDRRRRVTPVQTTSQEAWPEAEPLG